MQDQAVPCAKRWRGREAWLNRELGQELREKRFYDLWKKGQESQKNYKDNVSIWGIHLKGSKHNQNLI